MCMRRESEPFQIHTELEEHIRKHLNVEQSFTNKWLNCHLGKNSDYIPSNKTTDIRIQDLKLGKVGSITYQP